MHWYTTKTPTTKISSSAHLSKNKLIEIHDTDLWKKLRIDAECSSSESFGEMVVLSNAIHEAKFCKILRHLNRWYQGDFVHPIYNDKNGYTNQCLEMGKFEAFPYMALISWNQEFLTENAWLTTKPLGNFAHSTLYKIQKSSPKPCGKRLTAPKAVKGVTQMSLKKWVVLESLISTPLKIN